jgi:hypothetical protein
MMRSSSGRLAMSSERDFSATEGRLLVRAEKKASIICR